MFETSSAGLLILEMPLFTKALPLLRARVGKAKQVYQPLYNQAKMREQMKPYYQGSSISSFIWLSVHAYFESPNRGDLDNIVKGICDNLQFIGIISDDRIVKGITASIEEGVEDYTLIRINEVNIGTPTIPA